MWLASNLTGAGESQYTGRIWIPDWSPSPHNLIGGHA